MSGRLAVTTGLGFLLALSGCSAGPSAGTHARHGQVEYELITIEQQIVEAVMASPKEFIVPFSNEQAAWERVLYFFREYADLQTPFITSLASNTIQITNQHDAAKTGKPYIYMVEKFPVSGGMKFRIHCIPNGNRGTRDLADTNARNVARFIRDGTLERSILAG